MSNASSGEETCTRLKEAAAARILVMDGAMGTMIQAARPDEASYRGMRFANHPQDVVGNNELLTLTQPDLIRSIHRDFIEAGAEILSTNTFSATRISQADYGMEDLAAEMNVASARLAREAAEAAPHPVWIAGAIGPTNQTCSISPD
ncbi:MAG: homocysteine S-methyltransferase family protein, partial [Pseudomonadota bacterium]